MPESLFGSQVKGAASVVARGKGKG